MSPMGRPNLHRVAMQELRQVPLCYQGMITLFAEHQNPQKPLFFYWGGDWVKLLHTTTALLFPRIILLTSFFQAAG